jgi:hypothetical protein
MLKKWTPIQKYLLILGLCLGQVFLSGGLNYVFLRKSFEFEHIKNIVEKQFQDGALYYSALRHIGYPYKLSLYKKVKPKVVVLGSSRVWQFRSFYFTVPFVNGGGAMYSFREGRQLLQEMIAFHKPEVVILGLDPWWFVQGWQPNVGDPGATGEEFVMDMIFLPWEWLLKGKVPLSHYGQVLLGKKPGLLPSIGVFAAVRTEGFYKDGSFYYLGQLGRPEFFSQEKNRFSTVITEINNGEGCFIHNQTMDQKKWLELVELAQLIQRENIRLIAFLPPLPSQVIDLLVKNADKYTYIDGLRVRLPRVINHYYDFFDSRNLGSCDLEFNDGVHGGEITHLRILEKISQDPDSGLSPYLDQQKITAYIREYRGKAKVPPPFYPGPPAGGGSFDLGRGQN